jgi:hypothetical protein
MSEIVIDVQELYRHSSQAKLSDMPKYEAKCLELAGQGTDMVLTGAGPIWLYLRLAHALHGKARSLWYESPVTGRVEIFNHNPY